jgi:hypothetical protein
MYRIDIFKITKKHKDKDMATKRKTKTKAQKKARKAKFQQKTKQKNNQIQKMQNAYMEQIIERQEIMKRANIIEQIYKAKPEFASIVDNVLQINEEAVTDKDGVLYWTKDDNPVMAGLESFENYSKYSKDFVNQVLTVVQQQEAQQQSQQTTDVDLEGFDLVEDDSFEIVEDVETEELVGQTTDVTEVTETTDSKDESK